MKYFVDKVLSFFWAKNCYWCWVPWYYFCPLCLQAQQRFEEVCYVCKKPSKNFSIHTACLWLSLEKVIVLFHYKSGPIKKLLWDAKYYKIKSIYGDFLEETVEGIKKNIDEEVLKNIVITYPPMHFLRKWKRGYNHSEYFAKQIAEKLNLPLAPLLKKAKYTPHQSHLTKQQREKNLKESFTMQKKYVSFLYEKEVLIIDDVVSTGTTLNECAKILQTYGARKVYACIIASD